MLQQFYLMAMPGLETLAFSEVCAVLPAAKLVKFLRGIALFNSEAAPEALLSLRTSEDVFCTLAHIKKLRRGDESLRVLHSATLQSDLEGALDNWSRAHHGRRARTWRVVSQMSGNYDFRRIDAGNAVIAALHKCMPRRMHQVADDADVEVWCWLGASDALIGLRLSDASMRHRRYKREHLPASLRPTVAAAMGWLSRPTVHDRVLDPLCGAGTLLIERGLLGKAPAQLLGGDIRPEAVAMAERNAAAAGVAVSLQTWDARSLPLAEQSVTRIITNLPFGKQIGIRAENEQLYTRLLHEFGRVLVSDGFIVSLTSEDRLWEGILHAQGWRIEKKVVCVVLGQPASIFVTSRQ